MTLLLEVCVVVAFGVLLIRVLLSPRSLTRKDRW
jgi:hypothetical protein